MVIKELVKVGYKLYNIQDNQRLGDEIKQLVIYTDKDCYNYN